MKTEKIKTAIIIALLGCISLLSTCELSQPGIPENTPLQDTIFLSQWRREKQEKLNLISTYEKELSRLQHDNDSMQVLVTESKTLTSAYRFKAKHFERQLRDALATVVNTDSSGTDAVYPILDSLIITHENSDAACDTTIQTLETIVANRDSSLVFHRQIEDNLRDLNKEQELRNQILTEQLNLAFKNHRKKARQNKILAGSILILSGITTSLLLTNSVK